METKNDEISLLPLKITKNNITKITIETFLNNIDYEKKYNLNELKSLITDAFKTVKDKKKENVTKKEPSKYNIFIKKNMKQLKEDNPDMSNKEILKIAAEEWQKEKIKN